ncbi:MAG: hypothetical protein ABL877_05585 [Thiobacillus sp.]
MNEPKDQIKAADGGSALTAELEVLVKPAAWLTTDYNGNPMLWHTEAEAVKYCEDDEYPIPLYVAANVGIQPTAKSAAF